MCPLYSGLHAGRLDTNMPTKLNKAGNDPFFVNIDEKAIRKPIKNAKTLDFASSNVLPFSYHDFLFYLAERSST